MGLGVDKEGDHQILCMYESFVAEWKSNNPGKSRMTGKVSDGLHTQAIMKHSEPAGGRAKKTFAGMSN